MNPEFVEMSCALSEAGADFLVVEIDGGKVPGLVRVARERGPLTRTPG